MSGLRGHGVADRAQHVEARLELAEFEFQALKELGQRGLRQPQADEQPGPGQSHPQHHQRVAGHAKAQVHAAVRRLADAAERRSRLIVLGMVAAASLMAFAFMRPDKIFLANTPAGGDMGAHVVLPAYLRDTLLPSGRMLGWSNDWYAGFPMLYFYFPLPADASLSRLAMYVDGKLMEPAELYVYRGMMFGGVPNLAHVFGYTIVNDISARDIQFPDKQWVRGKSLDTFCPTGPFIVTADEVPDPQALAIRCTVNGRVLQDSSSAEMIFGVRELIARLSYSFRFEPGDLIASGTPNGVGAFRRPPLFLQDGDTIAVEIAGLGRLENRARTETA